MPSRRPLQVEGALSWTELFTIGVVAVRAQPMAEFGSGMIPDIALHLHPDSVGSPDLLAVHTDWQDSTKIR